MGPPSASRAEDAAAPVVAAEDAKAAAKDAEPTTTKDPQIALDDLELLLEPMTKAETETASFCVGRRRVNRLGILIPDWSAPLQVYRIRRRF